MTSDAIRRIFKMRILKINIKYFKTYINARPMTSDTIRRIFKIMNIKNKYKIFRYIYILMRLVPIINASPMLSDTDPISK